MNGRFLCSFTAKTTLRKESKSCRASFLCHHLHPFPNTKLLIRTALMLARTVHRALARPIAGISRRSVATLEGNSHIVRLIMLLASPTDNLTSISFQMTDQSTAISSLFSPTPLQEPSLQSAAPPRFPQHPTRSPKTTDSSISCSPSSHSMHVRM